MLVFCCAFSSGSLESSLAALNRQQSDNALTGQSVASQRNDADIPAMAVLEVTVNARACST
eukprot:SAG22_NODE_3190_length_1865_cov_1.912797_2_plen_60_part_01